MNVPLSRLRSALSCEWSDQATWRPHRQVGPDALDVLEVAAGTRVCFAFAGGHVLRARARVALPLLEWSEGDSAIRFELAVHDMRGGALASTVLRVEPAYSGSPWRWHNVRIQVPVGGHGAVLCLSVEPESGRRVPTHGWWGAPTVELPSGHRQHRLRTTVALGERRAPPSRPATDPLVSVLVPVHDPPKGMLEEAIESVRCQNFDAWQLCIVDDGSRDPAIAERLEEWSNQDPRIRVTRHDKPEGISAATNAALALAEAPFVALLDHDDLLTEDALASVAAVLETAPDTDIIYSDEEVMLSDRTRLVAYLKPDWSPDFLRSLMYTCHLGVYRRALVDQAGGLRPRFDGSQDYDLMLRLAERTDRIVHLPRVLYRWRVHEQSAAANVEAKPYAYQAARLALAEHLQRSGIDGHVEFGAERGEYEVRRTIDVAAKLSVLLLADDEILSPARRWDLLPALRSWLADRHDNWELLLGGRPENVERALHIAWTAGVDTWRTHPIVIEESRDRVDLLNRMVDASGGKHVLLIDGALTSVSDSPFATLASFAGLGVGAVGGKVVSSDGRVEHLGLVLADGVPMPILHGAEGADPGHLGNARVAANFSAVDGLVLTDRATFDRLGGLDAGLGPLSVVDYCLRARLLGLRVVSVPMATMTRSRHAGPVANDLGAMAAFYQRWSHLPLDPFYNPGFWDGRADFQVVS